MSPKIAFTDWSEQINTEFLKGESPAFFEDKLQEAHLKKMEVSEWLLDSIQRHPFYAIRHYLGFYAISLTSGVI